MKPNGWYQSITRICSEGDWDGLSQLRTSTNQDFASRLDADGLRTFYGEIIELALGSDKRPVFMNPDVQDFKAGLRTALSTAKSRLADDDNIKGIYFEYFFDGGDACTGNLFLCTEYSDTDDYWGAEFERDGFIEGPEVPAFFRFDPDFEWPDLQHYIADECANGILLAACIEEWQDSGLRHLPFGFANHDNEMVRIPAV